MEQNVLQLALVQLTLAHALQVILKQIVKHVKKKLFLNLKLIKILIVNACYNNPCLNRATCNPNGNTYICTCVQYYSGTNCQTC